MLSIPCLLRCNPMPAASNPMPAACIFELVQNLNTCLIWSVAWTPAQGRFMSCNLFFIFCPTASVYTSCVLQPHGLNSQCVHAIQAATDRGDQDGVYQFQREALQAHDR